MSPSQARERSGARLIEWTPLVLLVVFNLLLGLVLVPDYGISWDDPADALYGSDALSAYQDPSFDWDRYHKRKYYGPLHFMFQNLATPALQEIRPEWGDHDARRYVNLISFQIAIAAFFLFARQLVGYSAALTGTLLFALQPLFFGHAYINGKDIPFMAMFLLALALGYAASERLKLSRPSTAGPREPSLTHSSRARRLDIQRLSGREKSILAATALVFLAIAIELLAANLVVRPLLLRVIEQAYTGEAPAPLNALFEWVAEDRFVAPVTAYLERGNTLLDWARFPILIVAAIPLLVAAFRAFPKTFQAIRAEIRLDARTLWRDPLQDWTSRDHIFLLLGAGAVAGFSISIRVVGLLAVFLVGLMYVGKHRIRALPSLALFSLVAAAVCYLTWPYLWSDPFSRFYESYRFLVSDPNRDYVLFLGEAAKGRLLPWFYLPFLMAVQLSEPVLLLFAASLVLPLLARDMQGPPRLLALLLALWVMIPTVPLILSDAWFYDNFRQFLFVTPAFFLVGTYVLEHTYRKLKRGYLHLLIAAILVLPSAVSIIRLHPYQYIYYNALVGGARGAERRFELDYWATSYAEAMKELNAVLPEGSTVAFWGTSSSAEPFARPDLTLRTFHVEADLHRTDTDIAVMITRANFDLGILPSVAHMAEVTVDDALLAVVKPVPPVP